MSMSSLELDTETAKQTSPLEALTQAAAEVLARVEVREDTSKTALRFVDLSDYDDVLSDILLDVLYLGFQTHKMNSDYFDSSLSDLPAPSKPINRISKKEIDRAGMAEAILCLIKCFVVQQRNLERASELLLSGVLGTHHHSKDAAIVQEYEKGWSSLLAYQPFLSERSKDQISDFKDHMKRYLAMYLPSAGYEIMRTERYKNTGKVEACLVATRQWNPGDEIRHCTGVIAELTQSDEEYISNRDFSVMFSTRKACMCLFLGPARFVNHDCRPNCKFISLGPNAICFKVIKNIEVGEEITTFYGNDYFGEGNKECLCASCERLKQGGFSSHVEEKAIDDLIGDGQKPLLTKLRKTELRSDSWSFMMKKFLALDGDDDTGYQNPSPQSALHCVNCRKNLRISAIPESEKKYGIFADSEGNEKRCTWCARNFKIYGVEWPNRKQPHRSKSGHLQKLADVAMSFLDEEDGLLASYEEFYLSQRLFLSPDEIYCWDRLRSVPGRVPMRTDYHMAIFVFPDDWEKYSFWWPAMYVPPNEIDDTMPSVEGLDMKEYAMVSYLETHSFNIVKFAEMRLFDPLHEPFRSFQNIPGFLQHKAVVRGLKFLETQKPPRGYQWKKWNSDLGVLTKACIPSKEPCMKACCYIAKPEKKIQLRWKGQISFGLLNITFGSCVPESMREKVTITIAPSAEVLVTDSPVKQESILIANDSNIQLSQDMSNSEPVLKPEELDIGEPSIGNFRFIGCAGAYRCNADWKTPSSTPEFKKGDHVVALTQTAKKGAIMSLWFLGSIVDVDNENRQCQVNYNGMEEDVITKTFHKAKRALMLSTSNSTKKYISTIGIDYGVKTILMGQSEVKVNFWDVAGDPVYFEIRNEFYKDTHGAMLVYDVTSRKSFEALDKWVDELFSFYANEVVIYLVANKVTFPEMIIKLSQNRLTMSQEQ
ncbi:hypothetical protein HDU67_002558 [Dinochytrium kinnereticum]|nr:hypothetical protein HDU67_002558 [Dinochytrium kinnereticum]